MKRASCITLGLVALAFAATACEPAPPVPVLTVDAADSGGDTDPGDGTCETAAGTCTLPAAVEEANALGRAEIRVPASDTTVYPGLPEPVTGDVAIVAVGDGLDWSVNVQPGGVEVAGGASLSVRGVDLGPSAVTVHGTLVADRLAARSLHVAPGGIALVTNGVLIPSATEGPALLNEGRAWLRYTSIYLLDGATGIATWGAGQTSIGATAILGDDAATTPCRDTLPASEGFNATVDGSCALAQASDTEALPYGVTLFPAPGSPLVDAVPVGTLGCGSPVATDARGIPESRPVDGDLDGTAACDTGAYEVLPL